MALSVADGLHVLPFTNPISPTHSSSSKVGTTPSSSVPLTRQVPRQAEGGIPAAGQVDVGDDDVGGGGPGNLVV